MVHLELAKNKIIYAPFDLCAKTIDDDIFPSIQSTNATPVVSKINDLEIQVLDEKLVLVVDHGKPMKMKVTNEASASKPNTSIGDQLVESDEDEVELPDDETSRYMALTGGGGFLEDDLDFYDGYEA
ncbi:hypothetical protein Tco_0922360 [Tanacetum coccineum]|uniref:Uncharacterized protein n=1 Tax=Tanacetum coccineum TaxID=301880 RepID=A0ABQ5CXY3_9ASTR